jgi:HAD superfamily hydrolase (TIGR01509 family)
MTTSPVELVIFDCDGVLVDSEPIANRVFTEELARLGLGWSYDEVCERFIGLTMDRCLEIVERAAGRALPDDFLDRLQQRTFAAFRDGLRPIPGVVEALDEIRLPTCVASSGEPEKMRLTLGLTGLLDRFEGRLFSASEVERGKPHPDLFLHAARSIGVDRSRCLVIEDSLPGLQAARAAGMRALAFEGGRPGGPAWREGARVFRRMAELPGLIERMAAPVDDAAGRV